MNVFARRVNLWKAGATDREIAEAEGVERKMISDWRRRRGYPCNRERSAHPKSREAKKKRTGSQSDQLCWRCGNACGGCSWSRKYEPVPGWVALETMQRSSGKTGVYDVQSFAVMECPAFVPDGRSE